MWTLLRETWPRDRETRMSAAEVDHAFVDHKIEEIEQGLCSTTKGDSISPLEFALDNLFSHPQDGG